MAAPVTPLVVGNWKMNGLNASRGELRSLAAKLTEMAPRCLVVICPPATLLAAMSEEGAVAGILTGGQDCHPAQRGAHTGDISAEMLADAGAKYVIVGHSERRADHGETDALVRRKAEAAIAAHLVPIICVGETEAQRDAGEAESIVSSQLSESVPDIAPDQQIVVAYEPVWAIGTGRTPTSADIAAMHAAIRGQLTSRFGKRGATVHILYGGSMKPANAAEILAIADVDGGLVGGASLWRMTFTPLSQRSEYAFTMLGKSLAFATFSV